MLYWMITLICCMLLAFGLLLFGIKKRKMAAIYGAIAAVVLFIALAGIAAFRFVSSSYEKIASTKIIQQRNGREIYAAIFGWEPEGCTNVLNSKDQMVPFIDCCIWLEVQSCPMEMERILAKGAFQLTKSDRSQLSLQVPDFSEKPQWWDPNDLGDTILVFTYHHPDSDRIQRLFSNSDSTRFYLCDLVY